MAQQSSQVVSPYYIYISPHIVSFPTQCIPHRGLLRHDGQISLTLTDQIPSLCTVGNKCKWNKFVFMWKSKPDTLFSPVQLICICVPLLCFLPDIFVSLCFVSFYNWNVSFCLNRRTQHSSWMCAVDCLSIRWCVTQGHLNADKWRDTTAPHGETLRAVGRSVSHTNR